MISVIFDIEARRVTTETTAAGDCFNGAIATALVAVPKLTEAVEIACKPAAMPTTKLSTALDAQTGRNASLDLAVGFIRIPHHARHNPY